ncbi:MAG: 3-hydroxyacyl-CoA dehydrogenase/enoyl-CoA hydratase family protein, partial [Candidatus Bipolaricaulia bacterium]
TREKAKEALARITPLVELKETVKDADFVIEAVPELMKLKREIFGRLDAYAPKGAILATNTSSLSITEIGSATGRPDRVVGMHFFSPAVKMALVEVIRGEKTSDETVETTVELAKRFGKTPIICEKDVRGFIVNRVLIGPFLFEPAWMVSRGEATIEEIDSAMKFKGGFPMGPFELQDLTGIDIGYHFMKEAGEKIPPLIEEKVKRNELGRKTGRGFYNYKDGGADYSRDAGEDFNILPIIALMVNEAAKLLQDKVTTAEQIDLGMELGAGFPEGILRMADKIGLEAIVEELDSLKQKHGEERYEAAQLLRDMVKEGKTGEKAGEGFYRYGGEGKREYEAIEVEVDREAKVAWLTLNRPHRMNAIDAAMCREVLQAFAEFEADDDVRVVVIKGAGDRAFSVGVDVSELIDNKPGFLAELERFFIAPERFRGPVIAAIDGFALGGGMELALSCDFRIASRRSRLGQPEINLGLIPGGGGTQRLPRLIGLARAKELVMLGEQLRAEEAAEYGLVNRVVETEEFAQEVRQFAERLAAGPPIALRVAKQVMNEGMEAPLSAGLLLEREGFGILLSTEDMKEGVAAFLEKRKPKFEGK